MCRPSPATSGSTFAAPSRPSRLWTASSSRDLAAQARQTEQALAGGQSRIVISTTVIIIALLVLILIIVAVD